MSTVEAITLAIAVLGAVLGIINTWHTIDKTKVKLLVRPKHAIPIGAVDPRITFCIEVINRSSFAVTLSEVGVFYHGTVNRGALTRAILFDGGSLPRRLEPHSSITAYAHNPAEGSKYRIKCAYATTDCGITKRGSSPALKQIANSSNNSA
jgi:hypothetical protein